MTATVETPHLEESYRPGREPGPVDAIGTRLRLRALSAMGHSQARIARALGQPDWIISRVINGVIREVSPRLRTDACRLYDVWWCLRPPERTRPEKVAAAAARARAQRGRWSQPLGLDDEHLDTPGYRPKSTYRPAEGVGVADDPYPLGRRSA